MSVKDAFIIDLLQDMPAALLNHVETQIPSVVTVSCPTTIEASIIAQGVLAYNLNEILKAFQGLPWVELQLRTGQRNITEIGKLLASLEVIQAGGDDISIIVPQEGATYYGWFDEFRATADGVESMRVTVGAADSEEMTLQDGVWQCLFPIPIGQHTAEFEAFTADGEVLTASVSFTVAKFETYPGDGDTIPSGQTTVTLDPKGIDVSSALVTIAGAGVEMVWNNATAVWECVTDVVSGTANFIFTVVTVAGDLIEQTIQANIE